MTKFRHHRETLEDSMATVIEVKDRAELIEYLCKYWKDIGLTAHLEGCADRVGEMIRNKLIIEKYVYDERCNWDTYIVKVEGFGVMGMTDGPL